MKKRRPLTTSFSLESLLKERKQVMKWTHRPSVCQYRFYTSEIVDPYSRIRPWMLYWWKLS